MTAAGPGDSTEGAVADPDDRVDVLWFPDDDEYVVVAAGDGDRAVALRRYGRYAVVGVAALFAALLAAIALAFAVAEAALSWSTAGVVAAVGVAVVLAVAWWRYDPAAPPEVVARDEPVERARDEYEFDDAMNP